LNRWIKFFEKKLRSLGLFENTRLQLLMEEKNSQKVDYFSKRIKNFYSADNQ